MNIAAFKYVPQTAATTFAFSSACFFFYVKNILSFEIISLIWCREAPGITCLYTALLALIFFLEVVLGLAAYHTKDKVTKSANNRPRCSVAVSQ